MAFAFIPATGLNDTTQFPDADPLIRAHIQTLLQQIIDYVDNTLKLSNVPSCRAYNNANISIPNGALTVIPFNSELYDTDAIHDTVTNNTRLTCKTAGKYLIIANVAWALTGTGRRSINLLLNQSTIIASQESSPQVDAIATTANNVSTVYNLAVNDVVEVQVYQTSGAALNITYGAHYSPEFMMVKVG
jgi:hypothetical protein